MRNKAKTELPLMQFFDEFLKTEKVELQSFQKEIIKTVVEKKNVVLSSPRLSGNNTISAAIHKYREIGKYPVFKLVIKNIDGQEVAHQTCESLDVDEIKASAEKRGKIVDVYPQQEYFKLVDENKFQMVKRSVVKWLRK